MEEKVKGSIRQIVVKEERQSIKKQKRLRMLSMFQHGLATELVYDRTEKGKASLEMLEIFYRE